MGAQALSGRAKAETQVPTQASTSCQMRWKPRKTSCLQEAYMQNKVSNVLGGKNVRNQRLLPQQVVDPERLERQHGHAQIRPLQLLRTTRRTNRRKRRLSIELADGCGVRHSSQREHGRTISGLATSNINNAQQIQSETE